MSIDEIIKQAEKIKQEAEYQLKKAEERLDEKAKQAIEEVSVEPEEIIELVDDVKEFVPLHKKQASPDLNKTLDVGKLSSQIKEDNDIKIAKSGATTVIGDLQKTKNVSVSNNDDTKTKPVILSTNSKIDEDSDLHEIPTLVSVDSLDNGFHYNDVSGEFDEDIGVQITFDGFDDEIEDVPTIDEELAEKILRERREEKVGKFRLFGPDETDKDLDEKRVLKSDYSSEADKSTVLNKLLSNKASVKRKLIVTVVVGVLLVLLTAFKDNAYFPGFLTGHLAYFVTALVLYVIAFITNFNIVVHGFRFRNGLNFDFSVAICSILVLVHTVLLTFVEDLWLDNGVLLASVSCFAMVMSQLGKFKMICRVEDSFEFLTDGDDKYTLENITNTVDAQIITRGILQDEPVVKTSVKTDFPTNFLNISCKNEPADKIANPLSFVMLGLALVLFVVVGIMDNFNTAFNVLLCSISISSPVVALFATNAMLADVSKITARNGARVCGFEGAVMADNANAMVMEASDFFDRSSCDKHGIKIFNGTKIDEALLYSAAVMIKTKSPLAHVFDDVIIGKQSILPEVENIVYENKMGTSAWVYGKKVLVGNRNLLIAHGVSVPKESYEQKYTQKGRYALYLAVDGKICAMFILSYSANPDLKRELKKLEKSGITLIVRSCDPYINEQSLSELFGLPEGFIRVMNYSSARVFEKYSNMNVEKSPAYVIHNGTALSFVSAMRSAENIVSSKGLIKFLVTFGSAIGFAVVALLGIIGAYTQITAVGILAFQIVWGIFVLLISKLKRIGL